MDRYESGQFSCWMTQQRAWISIPAGKFTRFYGHVLKEGMTVVLSSSDSQEFLDISDRIYVFYEGEVSGMLSGDCKNAERLVACMMGMSWMPRITEGAVNSMEHSKQVTLAGSGRTPAFTGFILFDCVDAQCGHAGIIIR